MKRLLLALAAAALIVAPSADAAWPGANGRIAFERPGQGIFDVNPDGSAARRLTDVSCDDHPSYSPEGLTIAFDSCGSLFAVAADGSARRALPTRLPNVQHPVFGPGGTQIAVQAGEYTTGIYVQSLAGGAPRAVASHAYGPAWSPLGSQIAFAVPFRDTQFCNSTSLEDLWRANADGSGHRARLTRTYASYDPDFSPDGQRMVFTRDVSASSRDIARVKGIPDCRRAARAAGNYGEQVFVARANGRGMTQLTRNGGRAPVFSPDGRQIAFERRPYIYVMNADGSGLHRVAQGRNPAWQPLTPPSPAPQGPLPPRPSG